MSVLQEDLDWADLVTLDFNLFATPEGKKALAATFVKAVREYGFFYVKNFNISQERVNRQFSVGKQFYELPLKEKLKYVPEGLGVSFDVYVLASSSSPQIYQRTVTTTDTSMPAVGCTSYAL